MAGQFTPEQTLERLKKQAKRMLKALHAGSADESAVFSRLTGKSPDSATLRDAQHAIARNLGFPGWADLKRSLEVPPPRPDSIEAIANRFLDNACPDHHVRGKQDHRRASHTAMRLLEQHPELERFNIYTAVVCGNVAEVKARISESPQLVTGRSPGMTPVRSMVGGFGDLYQGDFGPKGWTPLLYLCFTRLPLASSNDNALELAKLLLDRGADPNAYFMAGSSSYTPLVGAIGEGEEDRPPHPQRDELVKLLLDAGADPYDNQVMYNLGFSADYLWYLPLIYQRSIATGHGADWQDPEWRMLSVGPYGTGARWLLNHAIAKNNIGLADWCLSHGANPNSPPPKDKRFDTGSLYEAAMIAGRDEIAGLLLRHGAERREVAPTDRDRLLRAAYRLDRPAVAELLRKTPALATDPEVLAIPARVDRADVIELLIDLGVSPDVANDMNERALHAAAYSNALATVRTLVARGAEIDPYEKNYGNTPLAAAAHYQHREVIDYLSTLSRDAWTLTNEGKVERLRSVLAEEPQRARTVWEGQTPLMWLPTHDEHAALEIARLLVAAGTDPSQRGDDGLTALDRAKSLGMTSVVDFLSYQREKRGT